ncbi:MAG: hypothetical protein L0H25_05135 [Micrococcales bacterium]|nr:hypothetical protein [Micrococcales bacterium]
MSERLDLGGERILSVSILGGRISMQKDIGLPFQRDVIGALEDLGGKTLTLSLAVDPRCGRAR